MSKRKKWTLSFLVVLVVLISVIGVTQYPKLTIISGYAAKNMASTVFIAQRTAASVNKNDNDVPLISLAETMVDKLEKSATAEVFGLMDRKAIYRPGLGCVLELEGYNTHHFTPPLRTVNSDSLPFPFGNNGIRDTVFSEVDYDHIHKVLDSAFANPDTQKTRTVLIAYKNELLAERYAEGFDGSTPILGWSMTKSVLATLYGIMTFQNQIDLETLAPIEDWQDDNRKNITINHLLRMQSGLEWDEDYSSISDVTRMLFLAADMTEVQKTKQAIAAPTEIWNYSSGTSNLLSGILRDHFDTHQAYLNFPYRALIDRIGMHSMLLEADLNGTYVGSSYAWASTRDWAKFGLLYLNRGLWNGERIFTDQWADYVSRPTKNSDGKYGAHFWLNANGKYPDVPRDLYSANGYQGQYVFIIPSKDLVVVRTGLAEGPFFDVNAFLSDILKALP